MFLSHFFTLLSPPSAYQVLCPHADGKIYIYLKMKIKHSEKVTD